MALKTYFAILGLALMTASSLFGQQEPAEQETETPPIAVYEDVLFVEGSLPHVPDSSTIATKLPLPLRQTPASVGVVSGPLLREQGSVVLGDALRNVSGLNVQTQNGVADYFLVRGFDSVANGLVLTDGAAEPEISFYQLYNVERVEVLKGPGGFLYGANPIAATVNMVRKQPTGDRFVDFGLSGGSFGAFGGTVDASSGGEGPFAFRLNGLWQDADGYRDAKPSEVRGANPAFSWRTGAKGVLNLNLEFLDTSFSPDAGLPLVTIFGPSPRPPGPFPIPGAPVGQAVADVPRTRSYQSPFDRSEQETRRAQIDYETVISDRLSLRNKTFYRRLEWLSDGTILNGVIPGFGFFPDQVARTLILLDDTQEFFGNQLEAVYTAETGAVSHRLLTGIEVGRYDDRFTLDFALLPTIALDDPVETAQGPLQRIPNQAADASSRVVSPYVIDRIGLSDRFQVIAGARWDHIDYEDEVSDTSRDFSKVSPILGLVWSPTATLSVYANAGRSFAPPSSRVVGERRPEEGRQVELGTKAELGGGRLQATLAVYELERDNVAIPDLTGVIQQTGTQRSRGVELELAAEPLRGLRTLFSYAYTDSELTRFSELVLVGFDPPAFEIVDRSGNVSAFAPEHIANLWLSKRFGKRFGIGAGGRYLSEQFIAEDNAFRLDSSFQLDAALFYDLADWRLNLHLKNLTDEEYFTRGFGNTSVIPAPGFSIHGGFEYRLEM
ncbi:MAG TPA: TonB-dependent siderophore receptor [Thermoanaerobaculia bacterium]|nr:TonB-dependent siderophore receptor [Thermoanaerobaculia bacterium]